jgi:hypothetical protein
MYAIHRPSGDDRGRIQWRDIIDESPLLGSHRCMLPDASLKKRRLGTEAQTAIVIPEVE